MLVVFVRQNWHALYLQPKGVKPKFMKFFRFSFLYSFFLRNSEILKKGSHFYLRKEFSYSVFILAYMHRSYDINNSILKLIKYIYEYNHLVRVIRLIKGLLDYSPSWSLMLLDPRTKAHVMKDPQSQASKKRSIEAAATDTDCRYSLSYPCCWRYHCCWRRTCENWFSNANASLISRPTLRLKHSSLFAPSLYI